MDEYNRFLSDRLLSEERPVTYRLLSRALDVHVNTAKEMLYDYHQSQNAERANSVHATYVVYGTKTLVKAETDGDVEMSSTKTEKVAPLEGNAPTTLTLAREDELTDILAQYQQVTSIHVYSLAPHPQRNLSLLAEVNAQLSEYPMIEDISAAAGKYGTIPNPHVQRRDRKSRPQIVVPESKPVKKEPVKKEPVKKETVVPKLVFAPKVKQEAAASKPSTTDPKATAKAVKEEPSEPNSSKEAPPSSAAKKGPAAKKGGIMQSFAKAAAKPPKPKPAPKKEEEDTAMALSDDGEADDSDLPSKKPDVDSDAIKKARQEREEALRRMMDEEDEDEDAEASEKEEEPADEEMEEAPEPEPELEPKKEDNEPAEVVSSTENGRRRGKRRVMKKKRILDDQGYMVTIQEPGWESFSEDEAPPPAKKPALASTQSQSSTPSSSAGKANKAAPKGQGNIMSFFSKK